MSNNHWPLYQRGWTCCGKRRGNSRFCSDCGDSRPQRDRTEAQALLEFFQVQRDSEESACRTFTQNADELESQLESISSKCQENLLSPRDEAILKIKHFRRSAEGNARSAERYGDWASILSELILRAGAMNS